jgi:hypothetical protein
MKKKRDGKMCSLHAEKKIRVARCLRELHNASSIGGEYQASLKIISLTSIEFIDLKFFIFIFVSHSEQHR